MFQSCEQFKFYDEVHLNSQKVKKSKSFEFQQEFQ
jgi:hypothetical protein